MMLWALLVIGTLPSGGSMAEKSFLMVRFLSLVHSMNELVV